MHNHNYKKVVPIRCGVDEIRRMKYYADLLNMPYTKFLHLWISFGDSYCREMLRYGNLRWAFKEKLWSVPLLEKIPNIIVLLYSEMENDLKGGEK